MLAEESTGDRGGGREEQQPAAGYPAARPKGQQAMPWDPRVPVGVQDDQVEGAGEGEGIPRVVDGLDSAPRAREVVRRSPQLEEITSG